MGNCCSTQKKESKAESTQPASQPKTVDPPVQRCLKFKSKEHNFSYKLEYNSSKSLSSYLNHMIISHPELALEELRILKQSQEITDFHLSLKDLEILPSDVLHIESRPIPKKVSSPSPSVSNEEIAEEESTTKLQIAGIKAKLSMGKVKTESTGDAASLWRSAMPSPKHLAKQSTKDPDASSLMNPMDMTIENKVPMQFVPYDIKNGQSVLLDSDDSYLKTDMKARDSLHRHPYDFFRDLQGPFSVLKQL
ncbi:hypothetical protein SteCoe_29860 [Stentor coeruleus]|uniref:Uncharacterized protein n=1 Tax=Stentor coeruleus TaxID=5963 RepID=A0A1R2B580_9CILI|nr:hypothetical protein SteCoe_29860 [Stentor coeruleus]